jgi:phosphoenolpyruvate carboxykinase (ATP)
MSTKAIAGYVPLAKSVRYDPSSEELREFTARMPNALRTSFGNYNVQAKVDARSNASTFIVTDHPERHSAQTITVDEGERLSQLQEEYIRGREMLVIDGFIGNDPLFTTSARLIMEQRNANVAGMQQMLYYPASGHTSAPEITIVYTAGLAVAGYPNDRVITVDLEAGITRVLNSDYFGESKKGGLRMWNRLAYDRGGLAMHAGAKVIPTPRGERVLLIVGLSGTGKTTTTFTTQNKSLPIQDDFIALMPGGRFFASENGCFAKTFRLDVKTEPSIYGAVTQADAYLENVSQKVADGPVDFFDTSYSQNGRAVFRLESLGAYRDAREVGPVDALLILNRNDNLIPAVARLSREQAAAYFMLGETQGTSAGGKAEMGKFLRVPGTNPFFPLRHEQQGNRLLDLLDSHPFEVFLLNTGRVGGPEGDAASKKLQIPHSSAVVKGIAEGTISWVRDPDFGYEVADGVPGIDDIELLQPRRLYQRLGRMEEYAALVRRFKAERRETLSKYPGLKPDILAAV